MRNKEVPFLLAAALLHAAVLGARWLIPSTPSPTAGLETDLRAIEIEHIAPIERPEREPPPEPTPAPAPTAEATPPPGREARAEREVPPSSRAPTALEPAAPSPEATGNPAPSPDPRKSEYDAPPEEGGGIIGIPGMGGPSVWSIPGVMPSAAPPAPAPTTAQAPRPVDKDIGGIVLRDAMRENDKKLGLDLPAAGTVNTAVRDAVQSSETPNTARATFEVRLGPDGKVLSVRVASFNGGASDAWERAAQAAAASLRGRTLQMNQSFSKGAMVYVDVSSGVQLPSGSKSVIRPQGLGASFDLSDIGAHARRVVKASFRVVAMR